MSNKVEKIIAKSKDSIEIMKAESSVDVESIKAENDVLKNMNKLLEVKHQNTLLKHQNTFINTIVKNGVLVGLLSVLSFLASTSLSLAGGYMVLRNQFLLLCFGLTMVTAQLIIFVSAKYSTIIANKFSQHFYSVKVMQLLMLAVSFSMNMVFFHSVFRSVLMDVVMSPLCFVLDYSTIVFANLGHDMKLLNTFNRRKGVLGKWVNNKFHKHITQIENTYAQNHNTIENTQCVMESNSHNTIENTQTHSKHIENTFENTGLNTIDNTITPFENTKVLSISKHKTSDRVKEVEKFINEKFDNGEQIKIDILKETFNLSRREWDTIRTKLRNIEVRGKKTYRREVM